MSTKFPLLSNRFRLGERIAAGGMACVYSGETTAADDPLAGRPLAIKVLHDHLSEDIDFVRMFRDEGKIAARFDHTHVVRVHAVGEDGGRHYIVMERIFGANLAELLQAYRKRRRRIPKAATFEVLRQILSALSYVHGFKGKSGRKLGVVHRDISPHNILISVDEKVRLTDFGIARGSHRSDQTRTGTIKGKLHYMSPEQARGKRVDHRADLYALGAVAFELFTERPLLQADRTEALQARVMAGTFDLENPKFNALGEDLQAWLRKCLAVEKEERWSSAQAMLAALDNVKGASSSRFKPGTLSRLLEILDEPSKPEQPNLLSEAEMAASKPDQRVPSIVIRTPQRPISGVFVGIEEVSKVRRMSRSDRLAEAGRRREPSSSRISKVRRQPRVTQDAAEAAVRMSEVIALEAAGNDPVEPKPKAKRKRPAPDPTERVSRVLVRQQRGVAVASMIAGSCVALLLFGTLLEVWNARLDLPRVDESTFAGLLEGEWLAEAEPEDAPETEPATIAAAPSAQPAPRVRPKIRNDRFLPRAAGPRVRGAQPAKRLNKRAKRVLKPHKRRPAAKKPRAGRAGKAGKSSRGLKAH
ncbi:MAG: serine/threonine protein kinase [Myxococcales bacterium]|nr:serine/threonine protein kinase [Myxococcales bacterium]